MPLRISRRNVYSVGEIGRYIPTEYFRRYIPTDFETELCPSVLITDGNIPSVIPLLFSGFLVVLLAK